MSSVRTNTPSNSVPDDPVISILLSFPSSPSLLVLLLLLLPPTPPLLPSPGTSIAMPPPLKPPRSCTMRCNTGRRRLR